MMGETHTYFFYALGLNVRCEGSGETYFTLARNRTAP